MTAMKIEGPNKTSGTKGVSKTGAKKGASGTDFSGLVDTSEETEAAKPASGVMSIQGIDALLSLQEVEDGTSGEARRRARERGDALLDQLDKLRLGLLTGSISPLMLDQLERMVSSHRDKIIDPQLVEILDDIDLRVQVELAKFALRR